MLLPSLKISTFQMKVKFKNGYLQIEYLMEQKNSKEF